MGCTPTPSPSHLIMPTTLPGNAGRLAQKTEMGKLTVAAIISHVSEHIANGTRAMRQCRAHIRRRQDPAQYRQK